MQYPDGYEEKQKDAAEEKASGKRKSSAKGWDFVSAFKGLLAVTIRVKIGLCGNNLNKIYK